MNVIWRASAVDLLVGMTMYWSKKCTNTLLVSSFSTPFHICISTCTIQTHQQYISHDSPVQCSQCFTYKSEYLKWDILATDQLINYLFDNGLIVNISNFDFPLKTCLVLHFLTWSHISISLLQHFVGAVMSILSDIQMPLLHCHIKGQLFKLSFASCYPHNSSPGHIEWNFDILTKI